MNESVIVSAVRTPIGKFRGTLHPISAPNLGALVIREVVVRANIDPALVDECIMGNVVSAGLGQNPARQAALSGGLSEQVAAMTINKVCGSGLKAVMLAAQGIATGDIEIAVAGGMESMSNCPYLLPEMRSGSRLGNVEAIDSMIHDGLWCALENCHMGLTGEFVAENYRITRKEQDIYAAQSHRRAAIATLEGQFSEEILPVSVAQDTPIPVVLKHDETIRESTTSENLSKLRPVFKKDGTITAGNAPGTNDGAAALLVMAADRASALGLSPNARIVGQATSGVQPKHVMTAPVQAVKKVSKKTGWKLQDVDLFELNEAFSAQAIAVIRELDINPDRVNVRGGAVALGHPIGASGARILTTLVHVLRQQKKSRGIATLCLGGGNAVALAIECF